MTIHFSYDKKQVLQALRYHFLARPEIRIMIIVVNVFALLSAVLYYLKKIYPFAFLMGSTLWFVLMLTFWEGLEPRETAAVLELDSTVVRTRLSRARTRMRNLLGHDLGTRGHVLDVMATRTPKEAR